jgi:NDP-sugar pyrophosphorylase family protein
MSNGPEVVFLCGGFGERMGELTEGMQKCMLPYEGTPILEHGMQAAQETFTDFQPIFAVGHRSEDVRNYFGDTWEGMPISYVEHKAGTEDRGALLSLHESGTLSGGAFIVAHGNIVYDKSVFSEMMEVHETTHPITTIALAEKIEESMHDIARMDDSTHVVTEMRIPQLNASTTAKLQELGLEIDMYPHDMDPQEKRKEGYLREMGVNVYDHTIFEFIDRYRAPLTPHMIWLYAAAVKRGEPVSAIRYANDWLHFETPDDLERGK